MKKMIILFAIVTTFTLALCGCENEEKINSYESCWEKCGHIKKEGDDLTVYYDVNTRVMYTDYAYGHTTVLLNPDGTPMLYKGGEE